MSKRRYRSWRVGGAARPGWLRAFDYILTATTFGLALLFIARMDEVATQSRAGRPQVHDGDTLTVGGVRMRLRGIDAPEYRQTCKLDGQDYACGTQARSELAALTAGGPVDCEGWETDRYGRLLATCRAGQTDLNAEMVRSGWAVSYGGYATEEREARNAARGLWRGSFETPREWRASHQPNEVEPRHDWLATVRNWLRQLLWPSRTA